MAEESAVEGKALQRSIEDKWKNIERRSGQELIKIMRKPSLGEARWRGGAGEITYPKYPP